jgi:hypothetical protein
MRIWAVGLGFRFFIFLTSAFFDYGIRDYDSSTLLQAAHIPNTTLGRIFGCVAKWDALYFLEIAHNGYSFEKLHAFFPLYPLLIRYLGTFISMITL